MQRINVFSEMKTVFVWLFFLLPFYAVPGVAQDNINFVEMNITLMKPVGFFNRNIKTIRPGFEATFLHQLKPQNPLFWGFSVYYNPLDHADATIEEVLDFQLVNFNYSTNSSLLGFNGKLRFYPDIYLGKLEFYAEAQAGYKWLFTYTTKTLTNDEEMSDTNIDKGSLSLTYGFSAGLNYPVSNQIYLNFKTNYLPGLSVPYYVVNSKNKIEFSSLDRFDLKRSTTDIFRFDFGITYKFNTTQNTEN